MRSKKLVIVYAVILFLIVFHITFNSVCAITQIDARFDVSSADAKQKAKRYRTNLDRVFSAKISCFSIPIP